ncbi:hypothetical protein HDU76_002401, partial [Blyttiomyces sp. JEL0837]
SVSTVSQRHPLHDAIDSSSPSPPPPSANSSNNLAMLQMQSDENVFNPPPSLNVDIPTITAKLPSPLPSPASSTDSPILVAPPRSPLASKRAGILLPSDAASLQVFDAVSTTIESEVWESGDEPGVNFMAAAEEEILSNPRLSVSGLISEQFSDMFPEGFLSADIVDPGLSNSVGDVPASVESVSQSYAPFGSATPSSSPLPPISSSPLPALHPHQQTHNIHHLAIATDVQTLTSEPVHEAVKTDSLSSERFSGPSSAGYISVASSPTPPSTPSRSRALSAAQVVTHLTTTSVTTTNPALPLQQQTLTVPIPLPIEDGNSTRTVSMISGQSAVTANTSLSETPSSTSPPPSTTTTPPATAATSPPPHQELASKPIASYAAHMKAILAAAEANPYDPLNMDDSQDPDAPPSYMSVQHHMAIPPRISSSSGGGGSSTTTNTAIPTSTASQSQLPQNISTLSTQQRIQQHPIYGSPTTIPNQSSSPTLSSSGLAFPIPNQNQNQNNSMPRHDASASSISSPNSSSGSSVSLSNLVMMGLISQVQAQQQQQQQQQQQVESVVNQQPVVVSANNVTLTPGEVLGRLAIRPHVPSSTQELNVRVGDRVLVL